MDVGSWQAQLRKGAAELLALSVLADGELYGLQVLEAANASGEIVSEGALYPLLNRLEREGKIAARWSFDEGAPHPRKYYSLTPEGVRLLQAMRTVWRDFRTAMTAVVET